VPHRLSLQGSDGRRLAACVLAFLGVSLIVFADVGSLGLDSHDVEMFRDHERAGADATALFDVDREQRPGRPVATFLKWLWFLVFGNSPHAFHWLAVGLHTGVSLALVGLLRHLGSTRTMAWLAACLFQFSVGHYEAVHHISALDYPLALLLSLLALWTAGGHIDRLTGSRTVGFLGLLLASLMAHTAMVAVVGFVAVLALGRQSIKASGPLLIASALAGSLTVVIMTLLAGRETNAWNTIDQQLSSGLLDVVSGALATFLRLASRLVTTAFLFPFDPFTWHSWEVGTGLVILVFLGLLAWKDAASRPWVAWILLSLCPFALLSPEHLSRYLPSGPSRYVYVASLGLAVLVALHVERVACRNPRRAWIRRGLIVGPLLAMSLLSMPAAEALSLYTSSRSYHLRGEYGDAILQLRRALDREPDILPADDVYRRLVLLTLASGNDARPVLEQARHHAAGSPWLEPYGRAIAAGEDPSPATDAADSLFQAQALHHLALGAVHEDDRPAAIAALRSALRLDPSRPHTRQWLLSTLQSEAATRLDEGDATTAVLLLREATDLAPNEPSLPAALGRAHAMAGHDEAALVAFAEAMQRGSADPALLWSMVDLHRRRGDDEAARQFLQRLLQDHGADLEAVASVRLGFEAMTLGDTASAVTAYRLALGKDGSRVSAHINLGWLLYERGDHMNAIAHFEAALSHGEFAAARFNRALTLLAMGEVERARMAYAEGVATHGLAEARRAGAIEDLRTVAMRDTAAARLLADLFDERNDE
jgi:tetratricopeptide (TPR) repeat protein